MGVISTDEWLVKDFNRPVQMMERLKSTFNNNIDADMIYHQLLKHGMYSPNQKTKLTWEDLKDNNAWEKTQSLFTAYKKLWEGLMFPYIFFRSCLQGYGIKKLKRSQGWHLKINYSFFTARGWPKRRWRPC